MGRRRKSGSLEDLLEGFSRLPWWVGVAGAAISYAVLHSIASQPIPQGTSTLDIGAVISSQVIRTAATLGQWILPMIFLAAASVSVIRRRHRKGLFDHVKSGGSRGRVNDLSWVEFEQFIAEAFRRRGYVVQELGGAGADGGVDIVLRKGAEKYYVQCKQWKAYSVGVPIVRELYGAMAAGGAVGGFVVTSGRFTRDAIDFARHQNIELIDGDGLERLLKVGSPSLEADGRPPGSTTPSCPNCGKPMIRRTARRGANAGSQFWGCSAYPACRGTRA